MIMQSSVCYCQIQHEQLRAKVRELKLVEDNMNARSTN